MISTNSAPLLLVLQLQAADVNAKVIDQSYV